MTQLAAELQQINDTTVRQNESLQKHTSLKIGGPADILVIPGSMDAIGAIVAVCNDHKVPLFVIGRGSNLLVPDEGIRGVVLKLGKGMDHYQKEGQLVTVGGGYPLVRLAMTTSRDGLSGFEFAGGIPGSLGGAVYMNAGAHGSDISQVLKSARVLFKNGEIAELSNEDMQFAYRTTVLQKNRPGICLEATFALQPGDADEITAKMVANKTYRKTTQPYEFPSAGSVFRNPLPEFAGHLIEQAGLKGHQIGGAQVSEQHANFIVNAGDAKANDVKALIKFIQDTIYEKNGISLKTEIEII
ncbi:UDP-N-acetylmuramate dehydrogenase [Aureibacillus halotolerans]|uniref:UDP-N-acetylenolpyruvoylglucosamine reductase n=1 Tax=Aureibacillus halotolerans TaxID=1508390 RepID=A0A4V6PWK1_9BACI|nr:UDP-N-acetylmuramate dehydrogenase [Aureibacillus halotolerans]TDQ42327.1 UDP-N-acetylmuramate dehydrogenase [Aureibacillus halotolerans]